MSVEFDGTESNFNSIKVRLEHPEESGTYVLYSFQFHKGTIRTSDSWFKRSQKDWISIP